MWPALASALAESRPKPLDAPVMTMTCFMTCLLFFFGDDYPVHTMPPLARRVWPLIHALSGPARNETAAAISAGGPMRSRGFIFAERAMRSLGLPPTNRAGAGGPRPPALAVVARRGVSLPRHSA